MVISSDDRLKIILDAPVGYVSSELGKLFGCKTDLKVTGQQSFPSNQFTRTVEISANGFQIIKAHVKFDSSVLPKSILYEILNKKNGIGPILIENNIKPKRNILSSNLSPDEKIFSRTYEITNDGIVWFTILEEIKLDNLYSNNNS